MALSTRGGKGGLTACVSTMEIDRTEFQEARDLARRAGFYDMNHKLHTKYRTITSVTRVESVVSTWPGLDTEMIDNLKTFKDLGVGERDKYSYKDFLTKGPTAQHKTIVYGLCLGYRDDGGVVHVAYCLNKVTGIPANKQINYGELRKFMRFQALLEMEEEGLISRIEFTN